jgi:hypothetical protein
MSLRRIKRDDQRVFNPVLWIRIETFVVGSVRLGPDPAPGPKK